MVASLLHAYGSYVSYGNSPRTLVWALSGSLAGLLVAAVNLLRSGRQSDRTLAAISLAGSLGWFAVAFSIGRVTRNLLDFRPLTHMILSITLAGMSIRALMTSLKSHVGEGKETGDQVHLPTWGDPTDLGRLDILGEVAYPYLECLQKNRQIASNCCRALWTC